MAKVTYNALLAAIQGSIGNLTLTKDGFIRRKGEHPDPSSPAQLAHLAKFGLASRWARALKLSPEERAQYEQAAAGHKNAHSLAVQDFMHAPVVQSIAFDQYHGRAGDVIAVAATDDFDVVRVTVNIRSTNRELIESGGAERSGLGGAWAYRTRCDLAPGTTIHVQAVAQDLPGNSTELSAYFYVS